jgi:predicted AAA+ superfamily ATPase
MSEDTIKIKLSTGTEVDFDKKAPKTLFEIIISEILIPKYKENADWNLSLNIIIEEMNKLIIKYDISPKLKIGLLNDVEQHLDKDIQELTGVDKIEILFLNMDDYVEDIRTLILAGKTKEDLRTDMANMIMPLTLFELAELFIYLGKRTFLK